MQENVTFENILKEKPATWKWNNVFQVKLPKTRGAVPQRYSLSGSYWNVWAFLRRVYVEVPFL